VTLIEKNREPSPRELRWFGVLLAVFLGLIGTLAWWRTGSTTPRNILGGIGLAVAAVYYAVPQLQRSIFFAWMAAVYPIGWAISHLLLAATYYVVLTPIGWTMRAFGRDPMQRKFDRGTASYWVEHDPGADSARYFRQF
jgi:hypothetical protein